MAVTVDAIFNAAGTPYVIVGTGTGVVDVAGMTVGSSANALLVTVSVIGSGADYGSTINPIWDHGGANQAMTLLGSSFNGNPLYGNLIFYGLINPVPGAKLLGCTSTVKPCVVSAISFNGVNALLTASAFDKFTSAKDLSGSSWTISVTVPSKVGNMVAGMYALGYQIPFVLLNQTILYNVSYGAANYGAGAASVQLGGSVASGDATQWMAIGIDIVAAPPAALTAVNFVGSAKTIGVPTINTKQVFTSANYVNSAPTLGKPVLGFPPVPLAAAVNYADSAPTLGAPALSAISVFAAVNFVGSAKVIDAPTLNVISGFAAANYADSAPTLGVPAMVITGRTLFANNLAVSSPFFSGIAIGSLTAPGLTSVPFKTGSPQLAQPVLVIPPKIFTAVNFIATSPQLGSSFCFPIIHMFAAAVSGGHPVLDTPGADELGPPLVWLRQRLKNWSNDPNAEFYDEDGTENEGPVQQSIFTNMNDDIELSVSSGTLVGRSALEWGPAEIIQPVYPLVLQNNKLQLDLSNLNYLNDAAAAAGGVPIGGIYRNGNVLMVRVT